jgi:hypothetical protein
MIGPSTSRALTASGLNAADENFIIILKDMEAKHVLSKKSLKPFSKNCTS